MNVVGKVSSFITQGMYSVATPFHPFGGAVDIIVVQQNDGTFRSTPWYVRFGKFQGVLKGTEKVVRIEVNGVEANFHMILDNSGEAYFVREVDPGKVDESNESFKDSNANGDLEVRDERATLGMDRLQRVESERIFYDFQDEGSSLEGSLDFSEFESSRYEFESVENVSESKDSNPEVVLVSVDGHILTAPVSSSERNSDNVELSSTPRFHLGPGEDTAGDYNMGDDDTWASDYLSNLEVPICKITTNENINDGTARVSEEYTERSRSLEKDDVFKSCLKLSELGMDSTDGNEENTSPLEILENSPRISSTNDETNLENSKNDDGLSPNDSGYVTHEKKAFVRDSGNKIEDDIGPHTEVVAEDTKTDLSTSKQGDGLDLSIELCDVISTDQETSGTKEEDSGTKEEDSGMSSIPSERTWRLWPIPFRRGKTIEHTGSNSSSGEVLVDFESLSESQQLVNLTITPPDATPSPRKQIIRTNVLDTNQIASLNLKEGQNIVYFVFSTRVLGSQKVEAHIYLWKWNARIVISDVDGTITKSDVLGQFMPLVGKDWTHSGIAHLFSSIKENGYQLLFLSARAIVQAYLTKSFLVNLKQDGKSLPNGPVVISPDGLFPSLYREVIRRAPHEFKIACLEDIKALFPPDYNPFYAGFGNRDTDELSYRKIGIPKGKIFIINPKGEVAINHRIDVKSYTSLHTLVHDMFPPTSLLEQEDYNSWNYWKVPLLYDDNL